MMLTFRFIEIKIVIKRENRIEPKSN